MAGSIWATAGVIEMLAASGFEPARGELLVARPNVPASAAVSVGRSKRDVLRVPPSTGSATRAAPTSVDRRFGTTAALPAVATGGAVVAGTASAEGGKGAAGAGCAS